MKNFELDLSNCELPPYWAALPKIIQAVEGTYEFEFDLKDDAVSAEARKIPTVLGNPNMPVGFDADRMPVGAVLRRLADSDEG